MKHPLFCASQIRIKIIWVFHQAIKKQIITDEKNI